MARPPTSDPWAALAASTPARIALGRAGPGLPTRASLAFALDHARARDAVHEALDTEALCRELGLPVQIVESAAADRTTYLTRPDLGRQLSTASAASLSAGAPCDLVLVLADGLSARAARTQGPAVIAAIRAELADLSLGPIIIATQARVALGDEVGAALKARYVAVLIGERPGLSTPDSLGIYLTRNPAPGRTDAERNCISNIHGGGLSAAEAAHRLAWLLRQAERLGVTGVDLKDESDTDQGRLTGPASGSQLLE